MKNTRIHLTAVDLNRTHFAFSPLWEAVMGFRATLEPSRFALHLPWICEAQDAINDLNLSALAALCLPTGYIPDFLTPPPHTPLPDFSEELQTLLKTDPDTVRREVLLAFEDREMPVAAKVFLERPEQALIELAQNIKLFWERTLEPHWPRLRAMLENDVMMRARNLALGGPEALFGDLHPLVSYHDGVLELDQTVCRTDFDIYPAGRGLLLMPSAFVWPRWNSIIGEGWQPTLAYTPRGVANLWTNTPPKGNHSLELLMGRGRAEVLLSLDPPSSTLELARRLKVSPSGISAHLSTLEDTGLVERQRRGRYVYYRLSPTGRSLLELMGTALERELALPG